MVQRGSGSHQPPYDAQCKEGHDCLVGRETEKMIYQMVDWAATYIESLVMLFAIILISGNKKESHGYMALIYLTALCGALLVAFLNSIQTFSFVTPVISIVFLLCVSFFLSTGKLILRAASCIMVSFNIWMIFVCILHGGRFEDAFLDFMTPGPLRCLYLVLDKSTDIAIYLIFRTRLHRLSFIWLWTNPLILLSISSSESAFIDCPH